MENPEHNGIPEVKTEPKEASETLSPDIEQEQLEFDFFPKEEVIEVGTTKVIFKEPTEEELPSKPVPRNDTGFIGQNYFSDDGEWLNTLVGKSPNGGELKVTKRRDGVGYELSWNGGMLPNNLKGWFTTYEKAESAARVHLATLWDKERKKAS